MKFTSALLMLSLAPLASAFVPNPGYGLNKRAATKSKLFNANQPREGEFDIEDLRHRIVDYHHSIFNQEWEYRPKPVDVHIIVFNADKTDEGVHTIEFPKGSGEQVILGFESVQDCHQFADSLSQQNLIDPTPSQVELDGLEAYCSSGAGGPVRVQVVPKGMSAPVDKEITEVIEADEIDGDMVQLNELFDLEGIKVVEDGIVTDVPDEYWDAWQ